jgi:UDP-glucuronate 4-epimerase
MSKTLLVTGAAGFIGSHVVDALLARGDRVIGIDDFNDYYDPARKRANVAEIRGRDAGRFELVEGDVRDEAAIERCLSSKPDAIVHLAAMAGVRASMDDPVRYLDVNVGGTVRLLEAARRHGISRFVYASTSSVYGNTETVPFVETDPAAGPLAPYPASKRAGELFGHSHHHLYGMHFTALRFFTVYGPRGRPDMMPFKLLESVYRGIEIPFYDGGRMLRDWTFVSDVADGVVRAVDRPLGYAILNIGRGDPELLLDFVRAIEERTGKKALLRDEPAPASDMQRTCADITRATQMLGYSPRVSVDEGVAALVDWYVANVR